MGSEKLLPDGSMTREQLERAALLAESRKIDLATAQELIYLRDRSQEQRTDPPIPAHGFEDRWRPELDGGKRREREERDDDDAS
jgi:hypothetical protein